MKILQVCNKIPFPPHDGGAIAILNIAKSLAGEGHEVVILAMNTKKHRTEVNSIPAELKSKIRFYYVPVDARIRPLPMLSNLLFSDLPYNAVKFVSKSFNRALTDLLERETFDIIQLEGLYLKPYFDTIRKLYDGKVVYRAHNIESQIWARLASQTRNRLKRFYFKLLAKRIYRFEKDFINLYDLLLPITQTDLDIFRQMGNSKPAEVINTGLSDEDFREAGNEKNSCLLFFIGALDWVPNQDGLKWFIDNVWTELKKNQPSFEFHVAGRNSPEWIERLCVRSGAVFHGEVPDSHEFMDKYGIMIVPLFAGSGLRIKIIEAMARSKVVITTYIGAQGLEIENGKHALVTDNAKELYDIIIRLSADHELVDSIRKNSYLFAREKFSNTKIVKNLINFYQGTKAC